MSVGIAVAIGVPIGIVSAVKRGRLVDQGTVALAMLAASVPSFWIGLTLIRYLAVDLNWFPVAGYGPPEASLAERLHHLVLPAIALGIPNSALILRFTRTSMLDVMNEDYVRTARAKGLAPLTVILKHALRNALIPILTIIGLTTAVMIAGAIVTETVFGLPGVGNLVVSAVLRRDYRSSRGAPGGVGPLRFDQPGGRSALCGGRPPRAVLRGSMASQNPSTAAAAPVRWGFLDSRSPTALLLRQLGRRPLTLIAAGLLATVIVIALLSPWLTPYDPMKMDILNRMKPPTAATLAGHRRVRPRCPGAHHAGSAAVAAGQLPGSHLRHRHGHPARPAGRLRSGSRRSADAVYRCLDGVSRYPAGHCLHGRAGALALQRRVGVGIVYTPRVARVVRAATLVIRELPFVEAATALGVTTPRIVRVHVLPNLMSPIIVQATFIFAFAILTEAALSFLGVGVPPTTPTWGNMIAGAQQYIRQADWLILFPGFAIVLTVLALQMVGDGLRDALDPRLQKVT
jgi:ABC-type dipeptide/oligopeptide/nickel transport system permease component